MDTLWADDAFRDKYLQLEPDQRQRVHRLVDEMLAGRPKFDWRRLAEVWPNIWTVVAEEMDGFDFEDLVAILLCIQDEHCAPNRRRVADKGVDLFRMNADGEEMIIECKLRRKRDVGAEVVRSLSGACDQHGIRQARLYTNRDFTREARETCSEINRCSGNHIELLNQSNLHETITSPAGDKLRHLLSTPYLSGLQEKLRLTGRSEQYVRCRTPEELQF